MRPLRDLLSDDPAWPLIRKWVDESERQVAVVPGARKDGEATLLRLQVTTRSALGALALHCGGIVADHGWLRILGCGGSGLPGLQAWNWGGACVGDEQVEGALVVANDVLGGVYAVTDTAFAGDVGGVFYFAPDMLEWEPMDMGHSDFVEWALTGDTGRFYRDLRWPGWEDESAAVPLDSAIFVLPLLVTRESRPISATSRKVMPLSDLWRTYRDLGRQLEGVADGTKVNWRTERSRGCD